MPDQVITEDLPDDVTMHVFERSVTLDSGITVWLRRYTLDPDGKRRYLADGRWVAQRGGEIAHLYANPQDATHGAGANWAYRSPHSFATWQDALEAARLAESGDEVARKRKARRAAS